MRNTRNMVPVHIPTATDCYDIIAGLRLYTPSHHTSRDPLERGFFKLLPANKADHLLQGTRTLHSVEQFVPMVFLHEQQTDNLQIVMSI